MFQHTTPSGDSGETGAAWFAALLALLACINAFGFALEVGAAIMMSDAWFFLDGWLGQFLRGELGWSGILYQPAASNTNLPLYKLLVLANVQWFDLDFSLESQVGTLAAIACCVALVAVVLDSSGLPRRRIDYLTAGLVFAWLLSLNSTLVFSWGLVTVWFMSLFVALVFALWVLRRHRLPVWTLVASLTLGILLDEVGIVAGLAVIGASALSLRRDTLRPLLIQASCIIAGLALAMVVYWAFSGGSPSPASVRGTHDVLTPAVAWTALVTPISDAVLHPLHRVPLFGDQASLANQALSALALLATLWFWIDVLRAARARTLGWSERVAVFLMLFSYGMVAGIALERVPIWGEEYFHQPRYTLFYLPQVMAVILVAHARYRTHRYGNVVAVLGVAATLALQGGLSAIAWKEAKYVSSYYQGMATTFGKIDADPAYDGPCAPMLVLCRFPPERRAELLALLRDRQLNLYSPSVRSRHRLYMSLDQVPK